MTKEQLHRHLEELAMIAELAQGEPLEALMWVLATTEQPGCREIRMAVVLFCQGLAQMRRETEKNQAVSGSTFPKGVRHENSEPLHQ